MSDKRNPRNNRKAICEKHPWRSRSMGVNKKDIPDARETVKKHGGRFDFDENGFVVATSNAGRNDAMKHFGFGDRDGGYGDHTG